MRAFGSPLCHHSRTTVPPTGCVTSKECLSAPPIQSSAPAPLCLPQPGYGDDGMQHPTGEE